MQHSEDQIRVLHVDDEPDFGSLARDMLERQSDVFVVTTAGDAEEGLDRLQQEDFDCIVSDYEMPGRNGIEFLRRVREEFPELPFILFTGKGGEVVASEAISAGVTDYLQKQSGSEQYEILANRVQNSVQQYRTEQAIDETQRRFQTLVEESTDVILIVDPDGTISYATPSAERILGRTPDELIGSSGFDPVHPEDEEEVMQRFAQLVDGEVDRQTVEFRYEKPDSSVIWAEARGRNLLDDPVTDGIVVYVRDTTDRKERELDLQRTERRYEAIFNDPNILVGRIDTDGTVIEINDTAMEYIDAPHAEVAGTPFWETPWFEHSVAVQQAVKDWIDRAAQGEYVEFETELMDPDGEPYIVEGVFRPVTNEEGEVISLIISDRDITERKERERDLERYKAYLEETGDIVTVFDEDGTVKYESPAVTRILGYEQGELVGETGFDYIHPDDKDAVFEAFTDLVSDPDQTVTAEYRFQTADGGWCWLEARGTNQIDTDPINGIITSNRDITERKKREQELQEKTRRNERFKMLISQTSDIIFVVDETGEISYINSSVEDILGYAPEELVGQSGFDLIHPEDLERAQAEFSKTIEDSNYVGDVEFRAKHANGSTVDIGARASNQLDDQNINGIVVVARDITERKEREEALEQYETLVEVAGDPMYMLDADGHIDYVNEKFIDLSGYPENALLGEHIGKVMDQEDLDQAEELIRSLLSSRERRGTFELEAVTADGDRIPAESHITLLFDDGGFNGSVGVMRVITKRLERQRRLKRDRDRFEEFAKVLSHDLRNPLNIATGRLDLLKEDCDSEHLETVERAHHRMQSLIDDMLSLANAGRTVGETEPVELASLADACWQAVETPSAGMVVETDLTIDADESRLRQLLENLMRNAVEHGGQNVTVSIGALADGFYVEDDGSGIAPDERDDVFAPGYSSIEDGTGFGLNIVREIADAHGWEIDVSEGSDGGARFEFTGVGFE